MGRGGGWLLESGLCWSWVRLRLHSQSPRRCDNSGKRRGEGGESQGEEVAGRGSHCFCEFQCNTALQAGRICDDNSVI